MHIVLANQWYPPESGWGGVAMWNYAITRALRAAGHRVSVISARWSPEIPSFQEREGIRIYRLPAHYHYRLRRLPGVGRYARPWQQMVYARQVAHALRALHREQPIQIVEFADVNAEGFFYARQPEVPVVVRCHTPTFVLRRYYLPEEMTYDTQLVSWGEKDTIRRANGLTAPSHDMACTIATACGVPPEAVTVIPNALPLVELPNAVAAPASCDASGITILHVGRLERVKGVRILAQAIPLVLARAPDVHFVFVGEDLPTPRGKSMRAELEAFLQKAGVSNRVRFVGPVEHETVWDWYTRADLCVVPTLNYESFSYTCAQAMAAGKPVVASRIGGIPETVQDEVSGLLVPPGDPSELAAALIQLARDPARRCAMGEAGRAHARREFDAATVAARVMQVYENARRMAAGAAPAGRSD